MYMYYDVMSNFFSDLMIEEKIEASKHVRIFLDS